MRIGGISDMGAVSFQPYIYNTNSVSSASMKKLSRISDDVLDKKIDYSELADESKNVNPLKKGQTLDFEGMLQMQLERSQRNAARMMKPAQESASETKQADVVSFGSVTAKQETPAVPKAEAQSASADTQRQAADDSGVTNFRMQQALEAYGMFMTA